MNKKESRKVFTKEFKEEIVFLVTDKGRKPSELAREFSINRNTIDRWVREFKAAGEEAFPG
ncbi:MAG: transposase, partial [Flavobacteriales bacterium]|nr:transposase [Flavobacteriales bacterium]